MTPLDAAVIRARAATQLVGREVHVVEETSSTNDLLFEMSSASAPEGMVVFAETQTAGRGQRGNRWVSPARLGLWFSILLRPHLLSHEAPRLTEWLAQSAARTVRVYSGIDAAVKPPNDVYAAERKLAGVLVDMRAVAGAAHVAICGVGINVNQQQHDFPKELRGRAASLSMLLRREIDRNDFAGALLRDLDASYRDLFG